MDGSSRKELRDRYKERQIVGGVYAIKDTVNGRMLVSVAADLKGALNRFEFSQQNDDPMILKLKKDWQAHGAAAFAFEVLEELEKKPDQSDKEFKEDLVALSELWLERIPEESLY